ncbi:unnamed protein product [Cuscuta campestris]|uniref:1-aminocyclopropane-1-carboxylate synthase n=1 Tax=Cuscuta campestris TaxID=132261 RepID=A0A484KQN4_9ASTE|nr:unnamed protein product [Cuscuta campestris]
MGVLSKIATSGRHGENSAYFDGWKAYDTDPFHPKHNPRGVIQMGLAENQLCFDMIEEWVVNNPRASICSEEGVDEFKNIALYQDYHGLLQFRKAVARFMERVRGDRVRFDPDRIVMSGGATGAHEILAFCLLDPGEAFLVPTPYYPGYDRDLRWRTGVELYPVPCDSSNDFKLTSSALESAYAKAMDESIRVKGLLINNPSNPLGTVLDRDTLKDIVRFANDKKIHLVCDEIYAATVFSAPEFVSVAEVMEEVECDPDLVHIAYSLSKDLGLPGFRVGVVYSYSAAVVSCARRMSSFALVSTQTQHLVASVLSDEAFVGRFLRESSERLGTRHRDFTRGLARFEIGTLHGNAGLFVWMDLRRLLREATFEAESELWRVIIDEVKLNVSPGGSFHCSEPGWFRVCFANMDEETMAVALARIWKFVGQRQGGEEAEAAKTKTKKKKCRRSLEINLSFRGLDDYLTSSPHHSPMSSPMVHATT